MRVPACPPAISSGIRGMPEPGESRLKGDLGIACCHDGITIFRRIARPGNAPAPPDHYKIAITQFGPSSSQLVSAPYHRKVAIGALQIKIGIRRDDVKSQPLSRGSIFDQPWSQPARRQIARSRD